MNKQHLLLIFFIIFLLLTNLLLFYFILGHSVLVYFIILLFILLVIITCFYFVKFRSKRPSIPLLAVKQGTPFKSDDMPETPGNTNDGPGEYQNTVFQAISDSGFSFHRKVIFIEIIIILILALNLILGNF